MDANEAIERLNKDPKDQKARKTLARVLGGYCALRIGSDGKIMADETMKAIEHCEETDEPAPEAITFAEWEKRSAKQRDACPITRRALLDGKLRIERPHGLPSVSVDWGPISEERRLIAAYRAEADGYSDAVAAVENLAAPMLTGSWERARKDWQDLLALSKPTPQQKALVEQVRARLVFQRASDAQTTTIETQPHLEPAAPGATMVVILAAPGDQRHIKALRGHIQHLVRSGAATFWDESMIPVGAIRRAVIAQQIQQAAVVVHLCSAEYLATPISDEAVALNPAARHMPVLLSPCKIYGSLQGKMVCPRNEQPVSKWADADSAWYEIGGSITNVVAAVRR